MRLSVSLFKPVFSSVVNISPSQHFSYESLQVARVYSAFEMLIAVAMLSSRQPGGCGLSWPEITVIKTDNIIVFQVVIWPVQLNPVNENLPLKEANFPAMS